MLLVWFLHIMFGIFPVRYGPVMSASVSSDGRYAISAHQDNHLVLWDLENQSRELLSRNANIYSARFVPDQDAYLWQDLDNRVRVESLYGETLKAFDHFPTYGHAFDGDLEHYLSADDTWNLFYGYEDSKRPALRDSESPSFVGTGKLLNLALSHGDYFLTAGRGLSGSDERPIDEDHPTVRPADDLRFSSNYGGVTLWRYDGLEPVAKLPGNASKTHATISPDGQWVVSGDENRNGLFWNTSKPDERQRMANYWSGIYREGLPEGLDEDEYWDTSNLIEAPSGVNNNTIALAFISNDYFLRFGNDSHKGALFKAGNPWPQKYFVGLAKPGF